MIDRINLVRVRETNSKNWDIVSAQIAQDDFEYRQIEELIQQQSLSLNYFEESNLSISTAHLHHQLDDWSVIGSPITERSRHQTSFVIEHPVESPLLESPRTNESNNPPEQLPSDQDITPVKASRLMNGLFPTLEQQVSFLKDKKSSSTESIKKVIKSKEEEFERYRIQEISQIEQMRDEELKKLKREKLTWEKQRKAAEILPNKKEKIEISVLKKEIFELIEAGKQKDSKNTMTQDRLKRKIDIITKSNDELGEEIKVLESDRIAYYEESKLLKTKLKLLQIQTPLRQSLSSKLLIEQKHRRSSGDLVGGMIGIPVSSVSPPYYSESTRLLDKLQADLNISEAFSEKSFHDGKLERHFVNNKLILTWYKNGTTKELCSQSKIYTIRFLNGDYKRVDPEKSQSIYWFAENNTIQTTMSDGLVIHEFENGQIERTYQDGRVEIVFNDGTVKVLERDGGEKSIFPDGTIQTIDVNGGRVVRYVDGGCETHHLEDIEAQS